MLRMEMINFNQNGRVCLQEISHIVLTKFDIDVLGKDKIYLPPESFSKDVAQDYKKSDIWLVGIILLFCMSLDSSQADFTCLEDYFELSELKTRLTSTRQRSLFGDWTMRTEEDANSVDMGNEEDKLDLQGNFNLGFFLEGRYVSKDKYSADFFDLLQGMLTLDQEKRPSAEELLAHPVFIDQALRQQERTIALTEPVSAFEKSLIQSALHATDESESATSEMAKICSQSMLEIMKLKID